MKLTPIDGLIRITHDDDSGGMVLCIADAKDLVAKLNAILPSDLLEDAVALLEDAVALLARIKNQLENETRSRNG